MVYSYSQSVTRGLYEGAIYQVPMVTHMVLNWIHTFLKQIGPIIVYIKFDQNYTKMN